VARARTSPRTNAEAPSAGDAWHESDGVLVIGEGIEVKGEIGSCRTLVVEGRLEASVVVEALHLAESGHYSGTAGVGTADIAGRFDGELTVEGDLRLRPSARVKGKIRYGRLIVEAGGQISGDVAVRGGEGR
jgi:cytoskeletal protein CcmA (bactofilin family)